jgi:hypothetical protein
MRRQEFFDRKEAGELLSRDLERDRPTAPAGFLWRWELPTS